MATKILNAAQAEACFNAQCVMNNVNGESEFEFRDTKGQKVRVWFADNGKVGVTVFAFTMHDCRDERYATQDSFKAAYEIK